MQTSDSTLGIIAGLGALPVEVAQSAVERDQPVFVVRLKGFEEPALAQFPGATIGMAEVGKLFKALKQAGCEDICFCGIVKRPDFSALKPDMRGLSLLPKVISVARKGDDALLSFLVQTFEAEGFRVIGADEASGALRVGAGAQSGEEFVGPHMDDMKKAAMIAAEIGRLDIGQGAVVCDGLVLSVEAQEGTDEMLRRIPLLDPAIRGTDTQRRGVLVKRPKPMQERRIDLPTIGVATVENAAKAGLAGIGVEAGGALLINQAEVITHLKSHGMFLYGFEKDWP
ncbi:MAG: LpxI family protein [Henriciella sp.]